MKHPTHVFITGASSGLGAALAQVYSASGMTLSLHGRDETRLNYIADRCKEEGANVSIHTGDLRDAKSLAEWIATRDRETPIDLVIANAGISGGTGGTSESDAQTRLILAVNVEGVMNTVLPLIPLMQGRKRGQIALISSLAGMRGLPSAPAYSASKAAVRFWGEGLRGSLKRYGIHVNVVCPGYIRTPMTAVNTFPMPMMMEPEEAAERIKEGLAANRSRIAFPLSLYLPLWLLSCISPTITDGFFAALPAKPRQ